MTIENRYPSLEQELDRIIQAELNIRMSGGPKKVDLPRVNDIIEQKNRQIVEAHQSDRIDGILTSLFSLYLQMKEGGRLHAIPEGLSQRQYEQYLNKKERFDTLFTAAAMAVRDPHLRELVTEKRKLFDSEFAKAKELVRLIDTGGHVKKEADMSIPVNPGLEETAIAYLKELAPLRSDLGAIEARALEFRDEPFLSEGYRRLRQTVHSAGKSIARKEKKAAEFLFDQAAIIFQTYKSTPSDLSHIQSFMEQKEELLRYLKIFDSLGDEDRKHRIQRFIASLDGTLQNLQAEVERQKAEEARISEKQQREINEAYARFQEMKEMFAQGELSADSQQKNAARKLKKYRDIFKAHGQRIMARDVERFMNSTGIGKPPPAGAVAITKGPEGFDYRKGFLMLLPITIALLFLLFVLILL
ncbi:MAG: hypothetical protein ACOCWY_06290 [Thermodesulfobacteriota bacterium]